MRGLWSFIKGNKLYFFLVFAGLLCVAFGGIFWCALLGKIALILGVVLTMVSTIFGLINTGVFWEEHN